MALSALVPLVALSLASAAPATDPAVDPGDGLAELLASGDGTASPLRTGVLLRSFYGHSDDTIARPTPGQNVSGVTIDDADVFAEAEVDGLLARLSFDLGTGGAELEDAYGRLGWRSWALSFGRFKPRVLRSNSVDPETLLFRDRTLLGALFDSWNEGVEVHGGFEPIDWWLSVTNGRSDQAAHHFYAGRLEWSLYDPPTVEGEGARGGENYLSVIAGGSFYKESDVPTNLDDSGWGGDLALAFGPWSLHGEIMSLDNGVNRMPLGLGSVAMPPPFTGSSSPWSTTVGRTFGDDDAWQGAVRYQDVDDFDGTSALGAAVSFVPRPGLQLVADVTDYDSLGPHGLLVQFGVVVGRTR